MAKNLNFNLLPRDVHCEIFSRFSVENLLQLTCVCKFFRDFIVSSYPFNRPNRVVSNVVIAVFGRELIITGHDDILTKFRNKSLSNPLDLGKGFIPGGSCNGIICFYYYYYNFFLAARERMYIYLWNPTSHQIRSLPDGCPNFASYHLKDFYVIVGLGFDSVNNDHKILRIYSERNESLQGIGEIYSLKNNSWKSISNTVPRGPMICSERSMVDLHGSLHWVTGKKDKRSVVAFDLAQEQVSGVYCFPEHFDTKPYCMLGVFKGFLSVMVDDMNICEIWSIEIMDKHCTWTKALEISVRPEFGYGYFHGLATNGKMIAPLTYYHGKVGLYDPETDNLETFYTSIGYHEMVSVVDYVASLTSVYPPLPAAQEPVLKFVWRPK